ncbi:MAG: carbonic anhydrase [Bacteriovoracaceae bacterium]|nr:carbonic anhydrase [Bacteriovoracaceae bacterium]
MHDQSILKILEGFKNFRKKYFRQQNLFQDLKTGQSPQNLVITCSDSRVDPSILFESNPGDIFVVRNVANLVPPYETGGGFHGVSAAIEFAVQNIEVKNIIILGHRQCGGIRNLMDSHNTLENSFVTQWMKVAQKAKANVLKKYPHEDFENQCRHCELEAIKNSIENLRSFPFIQQKEAQKKITIVGLYFDLEIGYLYLLSPESADFERIV